MDSNTKIGAVELRAFRLRMSALNKHRKHENKVGGAKNATLSEPQSLPERNIHVHSLSLVVRTLQSGPQLFVTSVLTSCLVSRDAETESGTNRRSLASVLM